MRYVTDRRSLLQDPFNHVGVHYVEKEGHKGASVLVWAPEVEELEIVLQGKGTHTLARMEDGYYRGFIEEAQPGDRYTFALNGQNRPDPASRFQPEGVFGPSEIVASAYRWAHEDWQGIPFEEWVIYELHMGTFTREGTFKAAIADLPRLKALGITTLEIMPVGQFSGEFGWGYDVAFPFAVQNSYGRPEDFKAFIDACHGHGLAVILDVVFNHFGAEGSVHQAYGPYNSEAYSSPWGPGLNFDGMDSEAVRHYFFQNAWQWLQEFRLDGLRLDSIHNIVDMSATPFLEELAHLKTQLEAQTGRSLVLIAESDKNDPRVVSRHGFNMEAQWSNDFQHNLHALLSGEQDGYYADYGTVNQMARIFERGVAYDGLYSSYRRKIHGRPFKDIPHATHVVFSQNHDQIGNRPKGDRLIENIGAEKARFAASCLLLSPFTPMLFMGEEWGEKRPFLYFVDYSDEELRRKVKDSRREEFKDFDWGAGHEMPDPAARSTFEQCILADRPEQHDKLQDFYRTLIEYSKLLRGQKATTAHAPQDNYFSVDYQNGYQAIFCFDIPDDSITAPGECLFCSRDYPKAPSHKDGALTLQPYTAYLLRPPQAR